MHFKRHHWICYKEMPVSKPSVWSQLGNRVGVRFSLGISYLGVYYLYLIWFRNGPNQFSIPCYPRQKRADIRSCRSLKMGAFYTLDFYLSLLHDFWHFTFQTLPIMSSYSYMFDTSKKSSFVKIGQKLGVLELSLWGVFYPYFKLFAGCELLS